MGTGWTVLTVLRIISLSIFPAADLVSVTVAFWVHRQDLSWLVADKGIAQTGVPHKNYRRTFRIPILRARARIRTLPWSCEPAVQPNKPPF